MNLSSEVLAGMEARSGFRAATLEKVLRLGAVAGEIGVHPFLGPRLVLKGGTAIQLGLGEPLRLSVDLDYNYIGQLDRDAMLRERPEVEAALQRVARSGGYDVAPSGEDHAGRKFHLGYRSHAGSPDRIEVDVNFLMRLPIDAPVERRLWQPAEAPPIQIRGVGDAELWAGKIVALLDRTAPRDLFDVAQLPERSQALVASPQFRGAVIAWCGILPHPLHTYGRNRLDRVDDAAIEQQLVPMIAGPTRPTRESLVLHAWEVLEPLLTLSESEIEYCDRLQRGELRPELVFREDESMAERFRRHPALNWKALNAREHHARRPRRATT